MIETPVEVFLQGPAGRYTATQSCIVWCVSPALCGLYFWGRPSADELLEVARIIEGYPRLMAERFDVVVDGREVEALDGEALTVQMAWLWQNGGTLLTRASIWSIVAEGTVAARLARMMPNLGNMSAFHVTVDASEAYRAVAGEGGPSLSAQVDVIAAHVRGLPRELHVIRALLGRRLDAKIEDAAKELGLSTRSLQRWLTSQGTSFHDEVVAARLATACTLLATTDLKIAAIGARLGISERAVTLLLRAQTGLSPMEYRVQTRARNDEPSSLAWSGGQEAIAQAGDDGDELSRIERLRHVAVEAGRQRPSAILRARESRQSERRRRAPVRGVERADASDQRVAVFARHADVGDEHIGPLGAEELIGRSRICRGPDLGTPSLEQGREELTRVWLIVDDDDP